MYQWLLVVLLLLVGGGGELVAGAAVDGTDHNNWAVIVSSSRFFYNYRHSADALTLYHMFRNNGFDDDHIIIFMADSFACHSINYFPAAIYGLSFDSNLYGCDTQIDYAGDDVDVKRFLTVLQGRYDDNTPPTRRLRSDENSNILIHITGHAAVGFFKFQDSEFLSDMDLADTFMIMHNQKRYRKILFIADTCHGIALCNGINAPNVACLASSNEEEESLSSHYNRWLGRVVLSDYLKETVIMLQNTSCEDPKAGAVIPPTLLSTGGANRERYSFLHLPLIDFNRNPKRFASESFRTNPAQRAPVNDPKALHKWRLSEFFCMAKESGLTVPLQYDLL